MATGRTVQYSQILELIICEGVLLLFIGCDSISTLIVLLKLDTFGEKWVQFQRHKCADLAIGT